MKLQLLLLHFLFILFSCDNTDIVPVEQEGTKDRLVNLESSTYTGEFVRKEQGEEEVKAGVTITLENNWFSGESDVRNFPAICNGRYEIKGNEIEFFNECMWTADFDWTLILGGKFVMSKDGEFIVLKQSRGGVTDTFVLRKQE